MVAQTAPARSEHSASNLRLPAPHCVNQGAAWLDLLAQINHDLRTPLNAVIGFSDVMSSELLGPVGNERYREYAGDIRDSGRRLLKAAEDTIAMTALLARSPTDKPRAVSLQALTGEVWTTFAADAAQRSISFNISDEAADTEVLAIYNPFRQTLINLLSEAMARTREGGIINLFANADGDTVRLEIHVADALPRGLSTSGPLAIHMARALLDLQGAGLLDIIGQDGSWRAVTVLDRVSQPDFFAVTAARPMAQMVLS